MDQFLTFCFQHFQVGIWTTAGKEFAEEVVHNIFASEYSLEFLLSHQRCTRMFDSETSAVYYIKDLKKLKRQGYRLEEMIMVDDTPRKLARNYGNLVRVSEWLGDRNDRELLQMVQYLDYLKDMENIRKIEKRGWQNCFQQN